MSRVVKCRDESNAEYKHRVRMLVILAHLDSPLSEQERILESNFTCGLLDRKLANHLATVNQTSLSAAERIATSKNAIKTKQKARQRYGVYC